MIDDPTPRAAALNMAMDEALLDESERPILRFYRWERPSLSFGYFGTFEEAAEFAAGRALVRRWTGGGIVPHGADLTYSLLVCGKVAAFRLAARTIYGRVHQVIGTCLAQEGVRTSLVRTNATKISEACFANPVVADVLADGRKIAGAAQRRTRTGFLQQGSIQLPDLSAEFRARLARGLAEKVFTGQTEPKLLRRAEDLVEQKYGTVAWLRRR